MTIGNDTIGLRFVGNDVNPLSVKPHEVAALIIGFENCIVSEIKDKHPEFDTSQLLFAFTQIKSESLGFEFCPVSIKEIVITTFTTISLGFQTGDFSSISNKTIKELKAFTKFSKQYNCVGQFKLNGELLSSFNPSTEIQENRNPTVKGDIKIFGKVIDSGGDNPNVHIKLENNERVLIFNTSEENAKELARRLYEKVELKGAAKWDAITYEIKEFKLKEIGGYSAGRTSEAIKELRRISSGYWDNYNSNDEINNQLLRD